MNKIAYEELEQLERILEKLKNTAISITEKTYNVKINCEKAIITVSDCDNVNLIYRDKDEYKQFDISLVDLYIISDEYLEESK